MQHLFRKMGKYVTVEGKEYLNLATSNFLGLVGDTRIEVEFMINMWMNSERDSLELCCISLIV